MGTLLCSGLSSEGEGLSPSSEERGVVGTLLCSGLSSEGDGLSPSSEEKGVVGREELAIERAGLWSGLAWPWVDFSMCKPCTELTVLCALSQSSGPSGVALAELTVERVLWTVVRSGMALGSLQCVQALGSTYGGTCSGDCGPVWHRLRQSSVCASPGDCGPVSQGQILLWGLWSCLAWPWADFSMCNTWAQLTVELALGTMILSGMALGRLQYVQYLGTTYCGTCSGDCGPVSQGQTSVCAILGLNLQ